MTEDSRAEFEEMLAQRAATSQGFRKKLLASPKEAIEELLQTKLPADIAVAVHEENENTLHFVLPPAGGELGAAELASVSGGLCWTDDVSGSSGSMCTKN